MVTSRPSSWSPNWEAPLLLAVCDTAPWESLAGLHLRWESEASARFPWRVHRTPRGGRTTGWEVWDQSRNGGNCKGGIILSGGQFLFGGGSTMMIYPESLDFRSSLQDQVPRVCSTWFGYGARSYRPQNKWSGTKDGKLEVQNLYPNVESQPSIESGNSSCRWRIRHWKTVMTIS